MRALIDTNLLIANLLSPTPATSSTGVVFQCALEGRFTLLFPVGVSEELDRKLVEDAGLATRIARADADELLAILNSVAEPIPYLSEPYPEVGRDRIDDFLIAHAIVSNADYLVTWDKDLLDLQEVEDLRIVTPPEFLRLLREAGLL